MIKYYFRSLRTNGVQELDTFKRGAWVYVEAPSNEELTALAQRFKLELGPLQDALDEDEVPRLEKEDKTSYVFVRFSTRNESQEVSTAPVLFVSTDDALITVTPRRLPVLDGLLSGRQPLITTQKAKLLLQLLQYIVEDYDTYINVTSKKIKLTRSRLRVNGVTDQDFISFATIEDELNEFLSSLQPMNATLRRLLLGRHIQLYTEDQDIVEDLLLSNEQSIEACNSNIKSIVGIRDAHSSISNNSLNRTMKIMTMATLGIAIPNLCFGIYSMNMTLPLQHEPYMFWIIIPFTIVLTLIVFWFGRRNKIF